MVFWLKVMGFWLKVMDVWLKAMDFWLNNGFLTKSNGLLTKSNALLTKSNALLTKSNGFLTKSNGLLTKSNGFLTKNNGFLTKSHGLLTKRIEKEKWSFLTHLEHRLVLILSSSYASICISISIFLSEITGTNASKLDRNMPCVDNDFICYYRFIQKYFLRDEMLDWTHTVPA